MSGVRFQKRLSIALFSPAKQNQDGDTNTMSPRASINNTRRNNMRSPRNSVEGDASNDQYLTSFRSATPNSRSGRKTRRGSQFQRSEVLSSTPASKVASNIAHDNVDAMELTACVDALGLRTEELLPIFEFYCSYGDAYNLELLKITNFARFITDTKMLPAKFPIGELQIIFVRSTRAVTASAQDSDLMHKRGEHAGKVHDNTCLTYVNWLEAICRIARVRIDRREKRRLHIRARNKQEAEEGLTADSDGNFSASNNDAADDQDELSDTFSTSLSNEVDTILEKNIIQNASKLLTLAEASELLEPGVTEVIRSDLPNLEVMFAFYSDAQKYEEALIGETQLKQFCFDFGLMPKLISKLELFRIFRKVSNGRFNLGFPDFIECVGRLALTAFNKPFFETAYPTNPEKVAGFLQWLEDSGYQRKIIEHDRSHGHGYHGRRLSSPQLLGTRASEGNGLKPSQAMLRRLTSQENRRDVSAATKRKAHDEAFAFQSHGGRDSSLRTNGNKWVGTPKAPRARKPTMGKQRSSSHHRKSSGSKSGKNGGVGGSMLGDGGVVETLMQKYGSSKSEDDGNGGGNGGDGGDGKEELHVRVNNSHINDGTNTNNIETEEGDEPGLHRMSSSVMMNSSKAEKTQRNSKHARRDSHFGSLRFNELAHLTGTDRPDQGTRRDLSTLNGDERDQMHQGSEQWNSDVKHVMRSEIATSVFSPHWGEERNLVRSVAALSPYRDALHEVFEYYCFLNNRRSLNITQLNATNWAKLVRDCHLVLDPRGITMNKEDALHAMEQSGCWVTPGEVDVVFVRSCAAGTRISGLDHGVLSFDTFQLALARLVRIIDARAGMNLRNYRHEFSSFEDSGTVDHAYYDGTVVSVPGYGVYIKEEEGKKHHTSLSISKIAHRANTKLLNEGLQSIQEDEEDSNDDDDDDATDTKTNNSNTATSNTANTANTSPISNNLDAAPIHIDELEPSEIDEYLLRRSVAAVDSGGAMTYVHKYDQHKADVLDLGEALALVTSRCILPHAKRITCNGYGHKEAMKYNEMLKLPSVVAIVHEEHQFTERMFMFYADIRDSKLPGFVGKEEHRVAVTLNELIELASDFGLTPSLCTKTEIFMCFRACRRNPTANSNMLTYPEFVECLARLALLSFSKPYLSKHHPKPQHKIHGFFGWCRASDGLKNIGAIEWSRGHSRAGLHITKGLLRGTAYVTNVKDLQKTPTDSIHHNNAMDRIDHTMNIIRKCSQEKVGRHLDLSTLFNHVDADGSGTISREEFVDILGEFVPKIAAQEHDEDSEQVLVCKEDVATLFDFFDADGSGDLEYTEFAYQFYNRTKVSQRMKRLRGETQNHGHLRGAVAANTKTLFDLDFVDEMTGDKPLTRSEVARLRSHMRQTAYAFSGIDPLKLFAMVDDDHNGLLSPTEFAAVMRKVQGNFRQHTASDATTRLSGIGVSNVTKTITDSECAFLFELIDTDHSGFISVKEFSEFLTEKERGKNEGHWMNALDKARQEDLLENERKRKMFIEKKELMGRRRRKEKERRDSLNLDDFGASKFVKTQGVHGRTDMNEDEKRKRLEKNRNTFRQTEQTPTIGSIINYEGASAANQNLSTMSKKEIHHQREHSQIVHETEVFNQRLQDVPSHFKKAPGEDAAIMRRRKAEEKKLLADKIRNHRTYEKNTTWKPRPKDDGVYAFNSTNSGGKKLTLRKTGILSKGHRPMGMAPTLGGFNQEKYEMRCEDGKNRREQAQQRMNQRLGQRPMYLGSAVTWINEEEEEQILQRTQKSISANDRFTKLRQHKMMENVKKLALQKSSKRRGSYYGYTAAGNQGYVKGGGRKTNDAEGTKAEGANGNGESTTLGTLSQSSSMSELENLAYEVEEVEISMGNLTNLDFDEAAEDPQMKNEKNENNLKNSSNHSKNHLKMLSNKHKSNQSNVSNSILVTPSTKGGQHHEQHSKRSKGHSRISSVVTHATRAALAAATAIPTKRRTSMVRTPTSIKTAFGSTVRMVKDSPTNKMATTRGKEADRYTGVATATRRVYICEGDTPMNHGASLSLTAATTSTKKNHQPDTLTKKKSWFGQTTHQQTQRRKSMNRKKLAGDANEHGVAIRKHKHLGGESHKTGRSNHKHGMFMTRNAEMNAKSNHSAKHGNYQNPHVYKSHAPKRVVSRPAFGSNSPRSPSVVHPSDLHSEIDANNSNNSNNSKHNSPKPNNESSISFQGKSARRGGRRKSQRRKTGHSQQSGIRSPSAPPNLHRASAAGIRAGWSPSIIRGTSVTAHTHSSSARVISAHHRSMTGSVNAREEDLGKVVNSGQLFERGLRE